MLNAKMIGNKIAQARKKISLSQAQLAERLFITSQAVGKWERGESMPDITTFNRLAEIFGVDLNYFSTGLYPDRVHAETIDPLITKVDSLGAGKLEQTPRWDMSFGNWVDADFSGLKHLQEKFSSTNILRCKFVGSDLSGLLLKSNHIDGCDFSNSDLSRSKLQTSSLENNLFTNSRLKGAEFLKSHMESCDFSASDLSAAQIQRSHFNNNLFKNGILEDAEFLKSHVKNCDFSGANFSGVAFKSSAFEANTITNVTWNRSSFIDTQISDVIFEDTLEDCYFENCVFNWVKFQNLTLTNTFFKNNRFKRILFVDCRADRITYEFLKSGKADLSGVSLLEV